jgi:AbrB family looped-hinge helix DNA binding protein
MRGMRVNLTITPRGNVTLPVVLRQAFGLKAGDQLIAEATPEGIFLRPAFALPLEIYSCERVAEFESAEAELAKVMSRLKSCRPRHM